MYIKRTLILSRIGMDNKKALVTIQKSENAPIIVAKFQENIDNVFAVVRYSNSPIEVVPLNIQDNYFEGKLPTYFDCGQEIYVVIVAIINNSALPIYIGGGKDKRHCFYDEVLKNLKFYHNKCVVLRNEVIADNVDRESEKNVANLSNNKDSIRFNSNSLEANELNINNVQNVESNEKLFEEPTENEINDIITNELLSECLNKKETCDNCVYKKAFYENRQNDKVDSLNAESCENMQIDEVQKDINIYAKNVENLQDFDCPCREKKIANNETCQEIVNSLEDEKNNEDKNGNEQNEDENDNNKNDESNNDFEKEKSESMFYNQIKGSLNSLFAVYPNDEILESMIDGGKFVRVDYENTGDYYSVGYISDDELPKYICYAIPCKAGSPPPKNMEEFSQYLPVDEQKAYYLMYQDATNGETIYLNNVSD